MKGMDKLKEKLPDIQGRKFIQIPLTVILTILLSIIFMFIFDYMPNFLSEFSNYSFIGPFLPIFGVLIVEILGFYFLSLFWKNKEKYLKENYATAYQKGLKYALIGVFMIVSISIHSVLILPVNSLFPYHPNNDVSLNLSKSLLIFLGFTLDSDIFIRMFFGLIFFLIGIIGYRKIVFTLGIDYMLMLYSYYPEESKVQTGSIYRIIQHPTYLSVLLICLSGFLFNLTFYTFVYLIFLIIGLFFFIRHYEEKELKERFGITYSEYQQNVPRFIPKGRNMLNYFKYLVGKF